ncbi:hypothetical protein QBC45DRAFT_199190 [Copromyces sp. CBS 386.78]|nr:hypothetical protein QBC45DRAFT_199190 [Copromyces sp. CBS 386.78]
MKLKYNADSTSIHMISLSSVLEYTKTTRAARHHHQKRSILSCLLRLHTSSLSVSRAADELVSVSLCHGRPSRRRKTESSTLVSPSTYKCSHSSLRRFARLALLILPLFTLPQEDFNNLWLTQRPAMTTPAARTLTFLQAGLRRQPPKANVNTTPRHNLKSLKVTQISHIVPDTQQQFVRISTECRTYLRPPPPPLPPWGPSCRVAMWLSTLP